MAIEIRELVIRANVVSSSEEQKRRGSQSSPDKSNYERQAIVRECVEQVLDILEEREER
jgi:hypothetical protein